MRSSRGGSSALLSLAMLLGATSALAAMPVYKGFGTFTVSTGTCTPPMPTGGAAPALNDILLLVVESENEAISLATANGFAEVTTYSPQGAGTAGVANSNLVAVFWKRAAGGDAAPVVADPGNHVTCQLHAVSGVKTTGNPWNMGAGASDAVLNTAGVIPGATTTAANCLVVLVQGTSQDADGPNVACTDPVNASLQVLTERTDNTTATGRGGGYCLSTGEKAAFGAYSNTTTTLSAASLKGAVSIALEGAVAAGTLTLGNALTTDVPTPPSPICYNAPATDLDYFTLLASSADNVTGVTVALTGTTSVLSTLTVTDNASATILPTVTNPGASNPITFTTPFAAPTGTAAQYRVKITPNPAMTAGTFTFTGNVTAVTDSAAFTKLGTDSAAGTITIDNAAPGNVTALGASLVTTTTMRVGWTDPGTDFSSAMVVRGTSSVTGVPVKGTTYSVTNQLPSAWDANETVVAVGVTTGIFDDTGLTPGATYFYRVFVRDACGIWSATGTEISQATNSTPTTTLGNGVAGTTGPVCPAATAQKLDGFSFVNSSGAVGVSALTVTTTGQAAITSLQIWDEAGTTQYFTTVNNPGSDTWNFSGGTTIPVSAVPANFKVLATYDPHASAPAGSTATTAVVSAYTTANTKVVTDTADTTLTLDNAAAVAATWGANAAGDTQVTLNWTYGTGGDSVVIVRYTANTDTAMPVDGTTYVVGTGYGTGGTVRYVGTATTFLDTVSLTNGTGYYYRIFEYDSCGNYAATGPWSAALTPNATTTLANGVAGTTDTVCPAATARKLDGFSFVNSSGTTGVTALTVTTAGQAAITSLQIWNEAGTTQYFGTVNNPGSDTWNFSGGTAIPVSIGLANFKIYATYDPHSTAPAGNTATTAVVGAYTTANNKAGTDTADTTLTLNNTAAVAATWGANTAGDAQVTLNWTYGTGGDSVVIVRYTTNTDNAMPVDGTTYGVGDPYGTGGTVRYVGTATTFLDTVSLTNGTSYYYRIFEYDSCGNYAATGPWSGALTPLAPTTTLANGVAGTNGSVCPAAAAQKLDGFSFVNNAGNTGVTALTVTTTGQAAIASLEIWDEAGGTKYFGTVNNPGSNTWNFSGGTPIPVVSTGLANFKVLATYDPHATAPAGSTATTGYVSAYTTANIKAGTDAADTTLTLDNAAAVAATWGANTPGNVQVNLNWTYGTGGDSVVIVRYTANTDTAMPVDGTTYVVGNAYGTGGTVRYVGSLATFLDTVGLTNGTAYYYRIFEYDACGNYAATAPWSGALTPNATTTLANGIAGTTGNVCPGATAQKLDGFSFVNSAGTTDVTALTVTTTGQAAIASLQIWNEAGTTQYFTTVNNSGSDTWNFSGGVPIPVSAVLANFKVYATYDPDSTAPAGNTATTGYVSAYTTATAKAGTDAADTTLTLDNTAAVAATWGANTPGNLQVTLNWSYGTGGDSVVVVRYTANSDSTMPVDGTTYVVGNAYGTGGTVRYVGSAATFLDTVGLSNGTAYYYRIFESDGCGNYAATAPWSGPLTPNATTTLANGIAGTTGNVCPAATVQKLDGFSFVNSAGTTGVTALTVTTSGQAAIASLQIWNEAGTTQYFTTVNNPGSDTWNFSGGVTIPVGTTLANFKVYATYDPHATAPTGTTGTSAYVSAYTTANNKAGTDTADTTVTLDNAAAAAATWGTITTSPTQITLNWTYGTGGDSVVIVRYTANTDTTMPVDGTIYGVNNAYGTGGIVRYVGSLATFSDTTVAVGTTYYYRIFEYDGCGNYAGTAPWSGQTSRASLLTLSNPGGQPAIANVVSGSSTNVGRFTLTTDTGTVLVTAIGIGNSGTAVAGTDVLRLVLFDDSTGDLLGTTAWNGTTQRAITNLSVTAGTPVTVRVVLVVATGATVGLTFGMTVAAANLTVASPAGTAGTAVSGNLFTITAGPLQGNANANAPTVLLVNPMNGATVTGPNFRVQVQVFNPGGLGSLTGVTLSTNGGSTYPTTLTLLPSYNVGANAAVYGATVSLTPGAYTLIARAANATLTSNSASAAISVSAAGAGDGMLLVRDNSSQLCSDCHAIQTHSAQAIRTVDGGSKYGAWGVNCRDCHTPHNTTNIYLVKKSITPPAVASYQPARPVKFSTRSGYDSTNGAATASYANADRSGPCQVCHTQTAGKSGQARFRNTSEGDTHYSVNGTEACSNCHSHASGFKGTTCIECHLDPTTDTDSFPPVAGPAKVSVAEWISVGHGLPAASTYATGTAGAGFDTQGTSRGDRGCLYCHDDGVGHNQAANPFRLANTTRPEGMNGACLVCHGAAYTGFDPDGANTAYASVDSAKNVNKSHYNNQHGATNNGGLTCWDCHDPHGDKSATNATLWYMLQKYPVEKTVSGLPSVLAAAIEFGPAVGGHSPPNTLNTKLDFQDYVTGGLCKNCHADGVASHYTKTVSSIAGHFGNNGSSPIDAQNDKCTDCHKHAAGFKPLECNGCHDSPSSRGWHRAHNDVSWVTGNIPTSYASLTGATTAATYGFACAKCHQGSHQNELGAHAGDSADPFPVEVIFESGGAYNAILPPNPLWPERTETGTEPVNPKNFSYTESTSGTYAQCSNTYCHSNGNALGKGQVSVTMHWKTTPGNSCTMCHTVPGTNASTAHNLHVTSLGYGCQRCHTVTSSDGANVTDKRTHVDGVKSVNFDSLLSNAAGTYDTGAYTCSNTYCHSTGVTAPPGPYTSGPSLAWNAVKDCRSCHAGNASASPIIGMTTGSAKHANHINNAANLGGVTFGCVQCHNATVTNDTTLNGTAQHVDGEKDVAFATINGNTSGAYAAPSCSSSYCHSSGGNENAGGVTYAPLAWNAAAWTGNWCNKCHGTANAAGYPQYTSGAAGSASANSHVKHVSGYSIGCAACHINTASSSTVLATGTLHTNGADDVSIANAHDSDTTPTNNYTAGVGNKTCSNVTCHATATGSYATVKWGDNGAVGCNSCHNIPTTGTVAHDLHVNATGKYRYACVRCHAATVDGTPSIIDTTKHTDNLKQVQFDSQFSQNAGTSAGTSPAITCSNTYCHSTGVTAPPGPYTSGPSLAWNTTKTCRSCHAGDATLAPIMGRLSNGSAKHANHVDNAANLGGVTFGCKQCHATTVTDNTTVATTYPSLHVDGTRTVALDTINGNTSGAYAAPSCSSSYCHSSGGNENTGGVTYAPIDWTAAAWSGNWCNKCHGTLNAAGYPQYTSGAAGSASANSHVKHVSGYSIGCAACHVSTASSNTALATGALHTNGVDDVTIAGTYDSDATPTNNYTAGAGFKTCNSVKCHTTGAVTPSYTSVQWGATQSCTMCHSVPSGSATAAHTLHVTTYGYACVRCHAATVDGTPTIIDTAKHTDALRQVQFDTLFTQNAGTSAGTSPAITCSNTYCHSTGQDLVSPYTSGPSLAWNTTRACDSCHGGTMANTTKISSGKHTLHINNAGVLGTNLTCYRCHSATVNSSEAISTPANHVNQVVNTGFPEGGTYAAPPSCSNVYCHSTGQATPTYKPVNWNDAVWATTCDKCHGTEAALFGAPAYASGTGGSATANSHNKHVAGATDCGICHANTTTSGTAIKAASTTHVDGLIQVSWDATRLAAGATYTAGVGNKTCGATGGACHGSGVPQWGGSGGTCLGCHEDTGSTETDDLGTLAVPAFWSNGSKATINTTEWLYSGHGRTTASGNYEAGTTPAAGFPTTPTAGTSECLYCHDDGVAHKVGTNPFRLRNTGGADGQNGNCLACHKAGSAGVTPAGQTLRNGTKKTATAHAGLKHTLGTQGGKFCWDCHDPHGDRKDAVTNSAGNNILMIQRQVLATTDGTYGYLGATGVARSVEFYNKTAPGNAPAPVGRMVESTTALGTAQKGLCQACHDHTVPVPSPTTAWTKYWNYLGYDDPDGCATCLPAGPTVPYRSGAATAPNHNQDQYCMGCHDHQQDFKGAGESGGGQACGGCHSFFAGMSGTSNHHHYLNNANASYPTAAPTSSQADANRNCLMCHVDHSLFRPDLNASGGRGKNLRTDILLTPTTTTNFTNSDFDNALTNGGICLSCHKTAFTKAFAPATDGPTTPVIDKAIFNASAHNYAGANTSSTFNTGGGGTNTFVANCSKCHNDNGSSYQSALPKGFALHDSTLRTMTAKLGVTTPADPLEEKLCWQCHRQTTDVLAGSTAKPVAGMDYYNAAPMTTRAEKIYTVQTTSAFAHPVSATSGIHKVTGEGLVANDGTMSGANRHTSCHDCHDPHGAKSATQPNGGGTATAFTNGVAPAFDILTDTTKTWTVNQWKGYSAKITDGTGAGEWSAIYGNTANTLSVKFTTLLTTTSKYTIVSPGLATASTLGPSIDAWGMQPTWPTQPTPPNWNDSAGTTTGVEIATQFTAPTTWTRVERPTNQGQICIKCHSSWAYGTTPPNTPSGLPNSTSSLWVNTVGAAVAQGDKANEFNPNNLSHHAVFARGKNQPVLPNYGNTGVTAVVNTNWPKYSTATDTVTITSGTATFGGTAALPATALPGWYIYIGSDTLPVGTGTAGTASTGFLEITSIASNTSFSVRSCTNAACDTYNTTLTIAATANWAVTAGFANNFVPPWGPWSILECADCHTSANQSDPFGPHGSARKWIMRQAQPQNFAFFNGTAVVEITNTTLDPDATCTNCHRMDVYGEFNTKALPLFGNYSRQGHPADSQNGSSMTVKPKWGMVCMNCHGGARVGAIHGTNLGKGNGGATVGSYSGKRFLAGASWFGVTRSTTTTAGACWTKGATDAVDNCGHSHSGTAFQSGVANYNYDTNP